MIESYWLQTYVLAIDEIAASVEDPGAKHCWHCPDFSALLSFLPVSASSGAEFRPQGTGGNVCNPCRSCSRPPSKTMHRVCTLQCCGQLNPLMEAD